MTAPLEGPQILTAMQAGFAAKLIWREVGSPPGISCRNGADPQKRFDIHRNNIFAGLIETLRRRFPVVLRLVGEAFFADTARRFIEQNPPATPVLSEYGGDFARFLEAFEPVRGLPYLPDIARLEWLRAYAYHAADADPMTAQALTQIPADRIGETVLRLHPSAGLLISDYPVFSIWETNTADKIVRPIGPDMPGESVLVLRPVLEVRVMHLWPGADLFLRAIVSGSGLAEAADAGARSAGFDLAGTLGALLAAGAFTCKV
jgi:hypothetical protein